MAKKKNIVCCKQCKKEQTDDVKFQIYKKDHYCSDCFEKCKCGKEVCEDNVTGFHYRGIFYCSSCFFKKIKQNEIDKHFAYIKFQEITGRVPTNMEWNQCERLLIQERGWNWQEVELVLTYVYEIEQKEISEEYGIIGLLPYYKKQAKEFYKIIDGVYESLDDDFEDEVITVYVRQLEKPEKKVELTSIDDLINWDDDDEYC